MKGIIQISCRLVGTVAAAVFVVAGLTGCGQSGGPERAVLTGKVTYQGQPVEDGKIRFLPIGDTKTPMWGAYICNGTYEAYGKGGVPVGTHKVEILAYHVRAGAAQSANSSDPLQGLPTTKQYLPEKYNSRTELEITIDSGSGQIVRDFNLTD